LAAPTSGLGLGLSRRHQHHTPECQARLAQLGDYVDGELEAALCAEIEQHLIDCDDCRVLIDATRKTALLYRQHSQQDQVELPADVTSCLWQMLEDKGYVSSPALNKEEVV
jgi:predicted anti-sigma-YlaC factor YlaD